MDAKYFYMNDEFKKNNWKSLVACEGRRSFHDQHLASFNKVFNMCYVMYYIGKRKTNTLFILVVELFLQA